MFYADQIGLKTVYDAVLKYQQQLGPDIGKPAAFAEKVGEEEEFVQSLIAGEETDTSHGMAVDCHGRP